MAAAVAMVAASERGEPCPSLWALSLLNSADSLEFPDGKVEVRACAISST